MKLLYMLAMNLHLYNQVQHMTLRLIVDQVLHHCKCQKAVQEMRKTEIKSEIEGK